MEHQDDALLRTGSEEAILPQRAPRSGSNSRAFKVAGLTVLACLLLAGQALTAYFVFGQRTQIHTLEKNADTMRKQLRSRPQAAPVQMQMPMHSMPLLMDFTDTGIKKTTPLTKLENTATVSLEKQVKDLLQNAALPQFNQTFLDNLQSLKQDMDENLWKDFETWIRHWLIFQMAQEKPPTPQPATELQTKCNMEATAESRKLGAYKPQCDEQGNYLPVQCWHSTGFCWCVDKDGNIIPNTSVRHRKPDCDRARPMMALPRTLQLKPFGDDKETIPN